MFKNTHLFMKSIYLLLILFLFNACVPYKEVVYLQGEMPQAESAQKEYKIKKNDILYINIKSSNPEIQKFFNTNKVGVSQTNKGNLYLSGYIVDRNGEIELPVIGKLKVENLSFDQVKALIKQKMLHSQFSSLNDIFIIVKLAGVPYSIVGEVNNPQNSILYKTNPNIFDVIANAGDIKLTGDQTDIMIVRDVDGKKIKGKLDLTDSKVVYSDFYRIRPNDIIYVKPRRQKTLGTGTTLTQTITTTITALSLITSIIILTRL